MSIQPTKPHDTEKVQTNNKGAILYKSRKPVKSIPWNLCKDKVVIATHRINQRNAWVTDRINVTGDRVSWTKLTPEMQEAFIRTFVILQRIDAEQGLIGMDIVADRVRDTYVAAVLRYQTGMEIVHSESYSRQLATFVSTAKEEEVTKWADNSKEVNDVIGFLIEEMVRVDETEDDELVAEALLLAMSTVLESFLFFLLFYYPLYLADVEQRMTRCAEVIRLILRDESSHGSFSGYVYVRTTGEMTEEQKAYCKDQVEMFISELYKRTDSLLDVVYGGVPHIIDDIKRFANYNFNRTLQNLGYASVFDKEQTTFHPAIESEVKNGLDVTHDIFSMTGNVYFMMKSDPYNESHQKQIQQHLEIRSKLAPPMRRPFSTRK